MSQATYRVQIPTTDKLGMPLHPQLPEAAHQWLRSNQPRLFSEIWTEGPHQHSSGPTHHLVTVAEESPETDGFVKQLAAHVGELANHPFIPVHKQGKNGVQSWTVPNRKYVHGAPSAYGAQPVEPMIV